MKSIARMYVLSSVLFLILSFPLIANSSFAETKTFIKEYTFQAGDEDSKNSSRVIALREVKRLLLEDLGTYLESTTEVQNFKLTKDQIVTLTAGIVQTEVIEEKWDGKTYWLRAKIKDDSNGVIKSIDSMRQDRLRIKELVVSEHRADTALKELNKLKKELKVVKSKTGKKIKVESYKRAVNRINASYWSSEGWRLMSMTGNNNDDAIIAFQKVIELDPNDEYAYGYLATLYLMAGKLKESVSVYSKAIKVNPNNDILYSSRGLSYSNLGQYKLALTDHNKSIKLTSKSGVNYIHRGETYFKMTEYLKAINDFDRGIEYLEKEIKSSGNESEQSYLPDNINNDNMSSKTEENNDEEKDTKMIPKITLSDIKPLKNKTMMLPDRMNLSLGYEMRGRTYHTLGNYKQAINDYTLAIDLFPYSKFSANTYSLRSLTNLGMKNFQEAMKDIDIAIELNPKEPAYYFMRAKHCTLISLIALTSAPRQDFNNFHEKSKQMFDHCNNDLKIAARMGHKEAQDLLKKDGTVW